MALPAVRRRYTFPSADLVTLNASIDLLVDDVFVLACRGRVDLKRERDERRTNIIVLGFPRSGNTSTRLTKSARESLSVPHVGMPA